MRRLLVLSMIAALAAVTLTACTTPGPSGGSTGSATGGSKAVTVEIKEFAFTPASVEIPVGGTVTWKNADAATHTVKGDSWGSGDLARGDSYSNTFPTAGTFTYSCGIHPSMTGEVVVK